MRPGRWLAPFFGVLAASVVIATIVSRQVSQPRIFTIFIYLQLDFSCISRRCSTHGCVLPWRAGKRHLQLSSSMPSIQVSTSAVLHNHNLLFAWETSFLLVKLHCGPKAREKELLTDAHSPRASLSNTEALPFSTMTYIRTVLHSCCSSR
jgi:hypothetical protein